MKKLSTLLGFSFILCTVTNLAYAQTPSSLPDTIAGSAANAWTVNCDMVQCPMFSDYFLKAVVWDDGVTGTTLFVDFNGTQVGTSMFIPSGNYPDVVIGDNMNNQGHEYTIAVTYMIYGTPNQVFIQTYNVDLNATPVTLTANGSGVLLSDPTKDAKFTHIDLFPDPGMMIGSYPAMYKYVACWQGASTTYTAVVGDINNTMSTPLQIQAINGELPDVAALRDVNNNTDSACFVYSTLSGSRVDVWDVTGATPVLGSSTLYSGIGGVRIEAMNTYNGSGAMYLGVAENVSGSGQQIVTFNDVIAGSAVYYSASTNYPQRPVVAAGVGNSGNASFIGNSQYTYSFHLNGSDNIAQDIDLATGIPASSSTFLQVNNSSTPATGGAPTSIAAHALSSSSNSGYGLLSAYWDGSDIYYKVSSTSTFGFKTTSINKIDTKQGFSIYPNPATDYINLNAPAGYKYCISDLSGKTYICGKSTGKSIDIKQLPQGVYIIDIHSNTDNRIIKFSKQ